MDTQTDPINRIFVDVVDTNVQTEDSGFGPLLDFTESASTQTDIPTDIHDIFKD